MCGWLPMAAQSTGVVEKQELSNECISGGLLEACNVRHRYHQAIDWRRHVCGKK
jgi:hypothetical protein